jgi:phosphotriesterase-related protein
MEQEDPKVPTRVNTVTGPISSADLGRTLIHEHVLIGFPGWFMDARQPAFKREEAMERVVDAFQELHGHGVKTVIDPCPMDLGRDVEFCAEVSQKSGVNLICATGAYVEAMGIPWTFKAMSVDGITEAFVKEIEDGVAGTGIRCGVIKIATGDGLVSDYERKVLTAAARAAKATGVPLISHTENCSCGHTQIDIATSEGLPSSSLIVGHSDGRDDHAYQKSLADRGSYVGFDRFGLEQLIPDAVRVKNLKALVDAGHKDRVMVSHDSVNCWLGWYGDTNPAELTDALPNWRMTHLFENIFPELKRMGMSQADLDHLVIENPRRYFDEAAR